MIEFLKVLTHERRLKAAMKTLSIDEIKAVHLKMEKIISDREEEIKEKEAKEAERQAKLDEVRKIMDESGLSIEELAGSEPKKKRSYPPKYRIECEGEEVKWSGHGRMPIIFKKAIDEGRSIEEFLIE